MPKILIIDDEIEICKQVSLILTKNSYECDYVTSYDDLKKYLSNDIHFDVALVDLWLKNSSKQGLDIISELNINFSSGSNTLYAWANETGFAPTGTVYAANDTITDWGDVFCFNFTGNGEMGFEKHGFVLEEYSDTSIVVVGKTGSKDYNIILGLVKIE